MSLFKWCNYAPPKSRFEDCVWFMVKWGDDPEQELLIWPLGEGNCTWRYGEGGDDPEFLSKADIKEQRIYFKGPTRKYTGDKTPY